MWATISQPFMVMEYLEGESLKERIVKGHVPTLRFSLPHRRTDFLYRPGCDSGANIHFHRHARLDVSKRLQMAQYRPCARRTIDRGFRSEGKAQRSLLWRDWRRSVENCRL